MPIYEFKCLDCQNISEILLTNSNEKIQLKCSKCGCENLERVMSTTNYAMGISGGNAGPKAQTRNCTGGSCTTIDLPGYSR